MITLNGGSHMTTFSRSLPVVACVRLAPAASTVRLAGRDVVLASGAWAEPRPATIVQIEDLDARVPPYSPLADLPGTQRTPEYLGYQLSFTDQGPCSATLIPAVESFTLQLPAIVVNGHETPIAAIAYVQQTLTGSRLACD